MSEYQIVQTDNHGMSGELPGRDEVFILWSMTDRERLERIASLLNEDKTDWSPHYYKVVELPYELSWWLP